MLKDNIQLPYSGMWFEQVGGNDFQIIMEQHLSVSEVQWILEIHAT